MKKIYFLVLFFAIAYQINGQNVFILDGNFKNYLLNNSEINTNGDTEIQVSEASAFSGEIDCSIQSITTLTGIEAFTALTSLNCAFNQITSLDLSAITPLLLNKHSLSLDVPATILDFVCIESMNDL